jgi:hypothetical protein
MPFITVNDAVSVFDRMTVMLWGTSRIGKTTCLLKAAEQGDVVWHIAADVPTGAKAAFEAPHLYGKRLKMSYAAGIREYRGIIEECANEVRALLAKGVPSRKMWVAVDTWTHLQQKFMTESRRVAIKASSNPNIGDDYVRDAVTQQDYGVMNGWSNECIQALLSIPCNIVVVVQEKMDGPIAIPVLVGQSLETVRGLLDVHCRVIVGQDRSKRQFVCGLSSASTGGYRGLPGKLNEVEPADLIALRDKYLAVPATTQTASNPK